MKNLIEPQILLLFNQNNRIYRVIFLSYKENLEHTKVYDLYLYLKKNHPTLILSDKYEIYQDHVLLTLKLINVRGYIQKKILKTDQKIIVFSLWDNIDYELRGKGIFNPFNINNIVYEKVPDDYILYEIYTNVALGGVFCILEEDNYNKKHLCLNGEYNESVYVFVNSILTQVLERPIKITLEEIQNNIYETYLNIDVMNSLSEIDIESINKIFNYYVSDKILITGDILTIYFDYSKDCFKNKYYYISSILYKKDISNKVLVLDCNNMKIFDIALYENIIIHFPNFEKIIIKKKNQKYKFKISFDVFINSILDIDYDIDFFLDPTQKTKNIFIDKTKKINIITSSKHIIFATYNLYPNLYLYLTAFIIGYQLLKKNVKFYRPDIKKESRYFSRYCQNKKNNNLIRRPVLLDNLDQVDLKKYTKINNKYYKSEEGDIFINEDQNYIYNCIDLKLPNIGFINEIYEGYNLCYPCCYKKDKSNTILFKQCIYDINNEIQNNPYIHISKQYRVILDSNKMGMLLDPIFKLFNSSKNQQISFNKYNRIIDVKHYYIYVTCNKNLIIKDINDIFKINEHYIFINNDEFLVTEKTINFIRENNFAVPIFLLIQNKAHEIKRIDKINNKIIISDISEDKIQSIFKKYLNIESIKNNHCDNISSKYFFLCDYISLEPDTLGYFIVNQLYKNFFNNIYTENLILFEKIWLNNLKNILNLNCDFNTYFSNNTYQKNLINKIIPFLDKKFISNDL